MWMRLISSHIHLMVTISSSLHFFIHSKQRHFPIHSPQILKFPPWDRAVREIYRSTPLLIKPTCRSSALISMISSRPSLYTAIKVDNKDRELHITLLLLQMPVPEASISIRVSSPRLLLLFFLCNPFEYNAARIQSVWLLSPLPAPCLCHYCSL